MQLPSGARIPYMELTGLECSVGNLHAVHAQFEDDPSALQIQADVSNSATFRPQPWSEVLKTMRARIGKQIGESARSASYWTATIATGGEC